MLDELISATTITNGTNKSSAVKDYSRGIPVSKFDKATGKVFLYNHVELVVSINRASDGSERIVGFDIEPKSIDWRDSACELDTEQRL